MALVLCRDLGAADWITGSGLPWQQLVCFGPAGFDGYARFRLLPDPVRPDQSENDAPTDGSPGRLRRLLEVLARHTSTPDDCYACIWEGFGVAPPGADVPRVVVPHRAYWLVRGPPPAGRSRSRPSADLLVADPTLDVVPADPSEEQPAYR